MFEAVGHRRILHRQSRGVVDESCCSPRRVPGLRSRRFSNGRAMARHAVFVAPAQSLPGTFSGTGARFFCPQSNPGLRRGDGIP
jgi:hypothetical protein